MAKRFMIGFATGYVLGARAGEKRYHQIAGVAQRVLDLPVVERLLDAGRDLADDRLHELVSGAERRVRDAGSGITGGARGRGPDDGRADDGDADDGDAAGEAPGEAASAERRSGQNPSRLVSLAAAALDRGRAS